MGPRACLDGCGKSCPQRDSIPEGSRPYRVAIPSELFRPMRLCTIPECIYIYAVHKVHPVKHVGLPVMQVHVYLNGPY